MELNTATTDRLHILLADPARVTPGDEAMLAAVVNAYPYFKAAHLLLARATRQDTAIQKAAVYSTGQQVYFTLNRAEVEGGKDEVEDLRHEDEGVRGEVEDASLVTASAPVGSIIANKEQGATNKDEAEGLRHKVEGEETSNQQPATDDDNQEDEDLVNTEVEDASVIAASAPAGSIIANKEQGATSKDEAEGLRHKVEGEETSNQQPATSNEQEEFFHWDLGAEEVFEKPVVPDAPEIETVVPDEPEHVLPSKYDDDNMPYSFLWWLSRTRAEHQQIFQPYAAPRQQIKAAAQEPKPQEPLQQQYVEHIFHLQTGLQDEALTDKVVFHKEDQIIDAFLEKDPQIKPPPLDKLDNENKARKSAEDHHDVVSETLASIYIEQMLYRKAIDTYEKLSLKFPEKSRYFADLIKSLEKKI